MSKRCDVDPIRDVRGPVIRRIANPQTFLTAIQVDRLIDDYLAGISVGQLAQQYGVHRSTVSAHLTRRGVVRRLSGLDDHDAAEAVLLHRTGASMRAISRALGVDRRQVRVSLAAAGSLVAS